MPQERKKQTMGRQNEKQIYSEEPGTVGTFFLTQIYITRRVTARSRAVTVLSRVDCRLGSRPYA